jgi:trimeric autotransporter adhesin
MAQDFHAAFGLGETSTGISTVDAEGVALAAIQGLNMRAEEQLAVIRQQQREIAELTHQMQDMRNVVADVLALKAALTVLLLDNQGPTYSAGREQTYP